MIIKSLKAENFRKFKQIQIDTLPERGLIGLVGKNESGKSSIGDAILFCLYGRTDQLAADEVTKVIRWGADQATVTLTVEHNGETYALTRTVSQSGQTVELSSEGKVLAKTPEAVEQQLAAILGYDYTTFVKTFYNGVQYTRGKESERDILMSMMGLKEHARLHTDLLRENRDRQQDIETLDKQREETAQAINHLSVDTEHLPKLNTIRQELTDTQTHINQLSQAINQHAGSYAEKRNNYFQVTARNKSLGVWFKIVFALLLLFVVLDLIFRFSPALSEQIRQALGADSVSQLESLDLGIAIVLAVIAAILYMHRWHGENKIKRVLLTQAQDMDNTFQQAYALSNQVLNQQLKPETASYLYVTYPNLKTSSRSSLLSDDEPVQDLASYTPEPETIGQAADYYQQRLNQHQREADHYVSRLSKDIDQESQRLQQHNQLQTTLQQQEQELSHERRQLVVFNTAIDLIKRNAHNSIERFNKLILTQCPEFLYRFTRGHYKNLVIKPDFSIKVMAEEKGDYLDFSEISAGTQRQIAMAMKIALASALTDTTKTDHQFLFLDEPFAFFDTERTEETLLSFEQTSKSNISQIWLTAQAFPSAVKFARVIQCPQTDSVLHA